MCWALRWPDNHAPCVASCELRLTRLLLTRYGTLLLACVLLQGMADVLRQVVAANGVAGLWRGGGPAIQRAALVNLGELATYDQVRAPSHAYGAVLPPGHPACLLPYMHARTVLSCTGTVGHWSVTWALGRAKENFGIIQPGGWGARNLVPPKPDRGPGRQTPHP